MKYALLIYAAPGASEHAAPAAGVITDWVAYTRAMKESGALVAAEQLTGTDTATSVRARGEDRLLTDGPFMETKEHLLGFFLIDVPDLDTALSLLGAGAAWAAGRRGAVPARRSRRNGSTPGPGLEFGTEGVVGAGGLAARGESGDRGTLHRHALDQG